MTLCSVPACQSEAVSVWRVRPRRLDPPFCAATATATCWPGQAEPLDLYVCPDVIHQRAVRDAATAVLDVTSIGDGEPTVRTVGEGGE